MLLVELDGDRVCDPGGEWRRTFPGQCVAGRAHRDLLRRSGRKGDPRDGEPPLVSRETVGPGDLELDLEWVAHAGTGDRTVDGHEDSYCALRNPRIRECRRTPEATQNSFICQQLALAARDIIGAYS